jgi:hypothetical protein
MTAGATEGRTFFLFILSSRINYIIYYIINYVIKFFLIHDLTFPFKRAILNIGKFFLTLIYKEMTGRKELWEVFSLFSFAPKKDKKGGGRKRKRVPATVVVGILTIVATAIVAIRFFNS